MKPTQLTRRHLLRATGGLAASLSAQRFGMSPALAQTPAGRRFVFVYIPGGWDQLLFLDPREFELGASPEIYRREVQRTGIDTAYKTGLAGRYANGFWFGANVYRPKNAPASSRFTFGPGTIATNEQGVPGAGPNLVTLAESGVPMSIIRGINMGTLGHEPGYAYFLTGEPAIGSSARGTSMPIRIASGLDKMPGGLAEVVTPVMALGVQSYTGDRNGKLGAFALDAVSDSKRLLSRPAALGEHPQVESALTTFARRASARTAQTPIFGQLAASRERTNGLLTSRIEEKFRFLEGQDDVSKAVRAQYGVRDGDARTPAAIAAFAGQAVKSGLAQFVSIGFMSNNVDSHGGSNAAHMSGLYPCIAAITALIDDLAKSPAAAPLQGRWLDHTTIVVFSEFGRTPLFNYTSGRDHHFANSCLLVGAGIRANTVVGATTEIGGMQPTYFDFDKQEALPDTARPTGDRQRHILPEDIGATLLASAGLDHSEYRGGRPLWSAITRKP